jgi:hypothetical protein
MFVRMVSILLILSLLATSSSATVGEESQTVPEMRKVALKAMEKSRRVTVVLKTKRDNKKKFTGRPSNVSEQGLTLTDTSSGQQSQFDFDDVREVRMKGSHVGLYVGIGVAAGVAIVALAVVFSKLSSD